MGLRPARSGRGRLCGGASALSKPVIIAANKADMDGALDSFQEFEDEVGGSPSR